MGESSGKSETSVLCRVGTILWKICDPIIENRKRSLEFDEWSERQTEGLLKALDKDSRVTETGRLGFSGGKPDRYAFYPSEIDGALFDDILSERNMFMALQLYDNISFTVKVPLKNQPKHYDVDDVPAEEYSAVWNGHTLYVAWQQEGQSIPRSGGHVVVDILSDAVRSIGHDLFVQSCEPSCSNQFMHTTIRIVEPDPENEQQEYISPLSWNAVLLHDEEPADLKGMLSRVAQSLDNTVDNFAVFKNRSRQLINLEGLIRDETRILLSHYYQTQRHSLRPLVTRMVDYRKKRGWSRDIRLHLARVWLGMILLENTRRTWSEYRRRFDIDVDNSESESLFMTDYRDDLERVKSLQLDRLEAAATQISERLDSGAVVSATQIGALAGGFAGGAVGLLANLLT